MMYHEQFSDMNVNNLIALNGQSSPSCPFNFSNGLIIDLTEEIPCVTTNSPIETGKADELNQLKSFTSNVSNIPSFPVSSGDDFVSMNPHNCSFNSSDTPSCPVIQNESNEQCAIRDEADLLELVDFSIEADDRQIAIKIEPNQEHKPNLVSIKSRFLGNSSGSTFEITLPPLNRNLVGLLCDRWLEMKLITADQCYMHINHLTYYEEGVKFVQLDPSSVRILLTDADFEKGSKRFAHVFITRPKLDDYDFVLKDFNGRMIRQDPKPKEGKQHAQAKAFREEFDLLKCRILCRLVIEFEGVSRATDISCCTNIIEEVKAPKKRLNSEINEDTVEIPTAAKKSKTSASTQQSLYSMESSETYYSY